MPNKFELRTSCPPFLSKKGSAGAKQSLTKNGQQSCFAYRRGWRGEERRGSERETET